MFKVLQTFFQGKLFCHAILRCHLVSLAGIKLLTFLFFIYSMSPTSPTWVCSFLFPPKGTDALLDSPLSVSDARARLELAWNSPTELYVLQELNLNERKLAKVRPCELDVPSISSDADAKEGGLPLSGSRGGILGAFLLMKTQEFRKPAGSREGVLWKTRLRMKGYATRAMRLNTIRQSCSLDTARHPRGFVSPTTRVFPQNLPKFQLHDIPSSPKIVFLAAWGVF